MRRLAAFLAIAWACFLANQPALAGKRVALVMGNSSYQTVPQLPNPSRDANAVAKMFRDAGFDSVETQLNVGNLEFKRSIRKFEVMADQADIAVVYYAGHGLEVDGTNYVVPVDAVLQRDDPMLQGAFLLLTLSVIGCNLLADLAYFKLDPRVGT